MFTPYPVWFPFICSYRRYELKLYTRYELNRGTIESLAILKWRFVKILLCFGIDFMFKFAEVCNERHPTDFTKIANAAHVSKLVTERSSTFVTERELKNFLQNAYR